MRWYAFLLYPFALLYDLVTSLRNGFFDLGWLKSTPSPISSIVIGNLSVGGTGKTPMVEHLIRMLRNERKISVLSRGYGRKTKGFISADSLASPDKIGDEPFQIYQKFGQDVSVYVGENRVAALEQIAVNTDALDLVILDDAYQHRYVSGDLTILLTTFQRPFYSDFLLPMGRLRESRAGAKRADVVIVTKCPEVLNSAEKSRVKASVQSYTHDQASVLFSSISYGKPTAIVPGKVFSNKVVLLTGLANDQQLVDYVRENYELLEVMRYPDHHDYVQTDFDKIRATFKQYASQKTIVLTTEKDAVKVNSNSPKGFLEEIPIFVLPIEVSFSTADELALAQLIQQKVFKKDII